MLLLIPAAQRRILTPPCPHIFCPHAHKNHCRCSSAGTQVLSCFHMFFAFCVLGYYAAEPPHTSYSTPLAKAGEQHTSILSAGRTEYCSASEYSATVEFLSACGICLSPHFQHALHNAYSYARISLYVYGALATIRITGASVHANITATWPRLSPCLSSVRTVSPPDIMIARGNALTAMRG